MIRRQTVLYLAAALFLVAPLIALSQDAGQNQNPNTNLTQGQSQGPTQSQNSNQSPSLIINGQSDQPVPVDERPLVRRRRGAGARVAGNSQLAIRNRKPGTNCSLLLSSGYHLTADITGAATTAGALVAGALGPDELLLTALTARLAEAAVPDGTPVVLAAAALDPAAAVEVQEQADLLAGRLGVPVLAAFATAARPTVPEAVLQLREQTGMPVAVAKASPAPGHFQDQLSASGADWVTEPLGDHPAMAGPALDRYRVARTVAPARSPAGPIGPPASLR